MVSNWEESKKREQEKARESEERLSLSRGFFFARGSRSKKATSIVAAIRSRFRSFLFGVVQMTKDAREQGWQRGQSSGGATAGAAPISESLRVEIAIGGRGRRRAAANLMTFSSEGKEAFVASFLVSFSCSNVPAVSEDRALNVKPVLREKRKVWERRKRKAVDVSLLIW